MKFGASDLSFCRFFARLSVIAGEVRCVFNTQAIKSPHVAGSWTPQALHICEITASPNAEHDTSVASSINRSKSYVTVFA